MVLSLMSHLARLPPPHANIRGGVSYSVPELKVDDVNFVVGHVLPQRLQWLLWLPDKSLESSSLCIGISHQ